ncbi:MAG: ABC transporter ATP-binding protein/permease [Actinomycetota bacterium]|nr:ABC transporter ATP-binding protein/permease [Actinomycetota bacterium]
MARRGHGLTPPEQPDQPARPGTFRRIVRTFKPYRRRVAFVGVLILIISAIGLINPLLLKVVTTDVILGEGRVEERLRLLFIVVAVMIASPIVNGLLGLWQTYVNNVVGQRVMQDLRNALYAHLQHMPLKFFTSTRTGEIQSRLSNDVGGVQSVLTDTASSILSNVTTTVSTVVAMAILSWELTVLSLAVLPFFLLLSRKVGKVRREVSGQTQESLADLTAHMQETLSVSGILLSKAFGRQSYEIGRFRKQNQKLAELEIRRTMVGRGFFSLVQIFFSITPALVYLVGGWLLLRGRYEGTASDLAGTIVAFTTLQSRLFFPMGQLLNVNVEIQSSLALFDRIFEYLDLEREIVDKDGAIELEPREVSGEVAFNDVWFRYERPMGDRPEDKRLWTLSGVDLTAQPGELVALVGPSGAGKTTMTYIVPRLYDVDRGSVTIDGIDVRDIRLESLGEIVGMVTQETYLFNSSVRDNLRYGNPDATDGELEEAAKAAHIYERIMELPEGFDTVVGERGYKMSGGEKQRLAIARVVLKDPSILILDEATSALDTHSERLVQEALAPLMKGRTTIAIAHRLSTILAADTILYLDRGRIIERGSHLELLTREGAYAALYHEQFSDGRVETRCEDGLVLATGEVVPDPIGEEAV